MKTQLFLIAALFAVGTFTNDVYAQKKKKPTKEEIAAQARKDSLNVILNKAKAGDAPSMNEVGNWYYTGINDCEKDYKKALQWYAQSAKAGNAYGIGNMAMCYQLGHGIEQDSAKSADLYKKAISLGNTALLKKQEKLAEEKNIYSNMLLASCYQEGTGVPRDLAKAAAYYEVAAKKGLVKAMHEGGLCYLNSRQPNKAFPLFKSGAAQGDVMCTYYTGLLLHRGNGVAEDWDKGADYMLKAAEAGMHNAQYQLGNFYKEGKGVRKDAATAAQWYQKSLSGYICGAAWELAELYRKGEGVAADYEKAIQLYSVAISEDKGLEKKFRQMVDTDADFRTSSFATYLKATRLYVIEKKYDEALAELKTVVKAKHTEAEVMQAVILADKDYKKTNAKKAAKNLIALTEKNGEAAFYLGNLYEEGVGVNQDHSLAITHYAKAAQAGSIQAMNLLGDMRYEGRGLDKDLKLAVELYVSAFKEAGLSATGTKRLASCYEEGLGGLKKDAQMAQQILKHVHNDNLGHLLQFTSSL